MNRIAKNLQRLEAAGWQLGAMVSACALQRTATDCKALQHTATHCNTLQHIRKDSRLLVGVGVGWLGVVGSFKL